MKKVALLFICLNFPYWEYAQEAIEGAKKYFLPNHKVDLFFWSDMPSRDDCIVMETEPTDWPLPTLMRYHLFLREEEKLKEYDYIFYCDIDMRFVDTIGDEILGEGLTAAQHPMYVFRPGLQFPLEPNPESSAYIPVPKHYFAGGFQGGRSADFIRAMWTMKRNIDSDFMRDYIARWNDESHWNRYLFYNPPKVILDPSYVYPDSLVNEYYKPIWGRDFTPKIITLTKRFTLTKEGGTMAMKFAEDYKNLNNIK